jgi:hypothetical protein
MNVCKCFETENIAYAFKINNKEYFITPLRTLVDFPPNVNSFAIIINTESNAKDIMFDQLIGDWKDFYEATMTKNEEVMTGYIVLNMSIQEASDLAQKTLSDYFAYWNNHQLNIFHTESSELLDVWGTTPVLHLH